MSIEEQFYLAFPLALLTVWKLRPKIVVLIAAIRAALLGSLGWQVFLARSDVNRAYLGTDARVYQILTGALLATIFWRWNIAGGVADRAPARRSAQGASALALVGFVLVASSALDVAVSNRKLAATVLSARANGTTGLTAS